MFKQIKKPKDIPETIMDCIIYLNGIVDKHPSNAVFIHNSTEDQFIGSAHMGIGRWIRNNWGLWEGKSKLYNYFINNGLGHADDMSGIILTSFYRHYHDLPMKIDEQIQGYKDYWEEQNINPLTQESY